MPSTIGWLQAAVLLSLQNMNPAPLAAPHASKSAPPGYLCRCGGGSAALPLPGLTLESEGPLQYNEQEWEQGWVSQGGEQVYAVRMIVSGHPG